MPFYKRYDHYEALKNFQPNGDGTFGPHKWDQETLCAWADEDMKHMRRANRIEMGLAVAVILLIIALCFFT